MIEVRVVVGVTGTAVAVTWVRGAGWCCPAEGRAGMNSPRYATAPDESGFSAEKTTKPDSSGAVR